MLLARKHMKKRKAQDEADGARENVNIFNLFYFMIIIIKLLITFFHTLLKKPF